jgi:hypothetical protein
MGMLSAMGMLPSASPYLAVFFHLNLIHVSVLHNQLLRSTLETNDGYEIDFKENSFFAAFSNIQDAVNWCISAQIGLVNVKWPQELLSQTG